MSSETIPVPEPVRETAAHSPVTESRSLSDLLPMGSLRVLVAAGALASIVASFADFGLHGRALVGAVLCPTLILLAAIDAKHRLLPNAIILPRR